MGHHHVDAATNGRIFIRRCEVGSLAYKMAAIPLTIRKERKKLKEMTEEEFIEDWKKEKNVST